MQRAEVLQAKGYVHCDPGEVAPGIARYDLLADLALPHLPQGGRVLDLGCGSGEILAAIQARRPDALLYGGDAYQACLDSTASRVTLTGQYLIPEGGFDLSGITERFDVIVFSHTLEHLWHPAQGVVDLMGLLRPGGVAVIAVPNLARPDTLIKAATRRHYVNRGHLLGWDHSHFRNFLEEILKLKVLGYYSDGVPIFPRGLAKRISLFAKIETALGRVVPYWSFSNIAVVQAAGQDAPKQIASAS